VPQSRGECIGSRKPMPIVKGIDDNFDDNPGERRQTPANNRFE
jgi:hypothetical protein